MLINSNLKDIIKSSYLLDDEEKLVKDNEFEISVSDKDSVLSILTDYSLILTEIKRSSD